VGLPFSRSLRALDRDVRRRGRWAVPIRIVLLAAWIVWALTAEVQVWVVARRARVEVRAAPHRIETESAGRVVAVHLVLDAEVTAGEVLVELDSQPIMDHLVQERARLAAIEARLAEARVAIGAEGRSGAAKAGADDAGLTRARAVALAADTAATQAEDDALRLAALHDSGSVSASERDAARADARRKRQLAAAEIAAVEEMVSGLARRMRNGPSPGSHVTQRS